MTNQNDQNTSIQNKPTNSDETTLQQEVDLPTPEKKNDEITTGNRLSDNEQRGDDKWTQTTETGTQNQNDQSGNNPQDQQNSEKKTGFDVNQKTQGRNEEAHRGDTTEKERREREDNPEKAEFQDADWQKDKMNEANNEDTKRNPRDEQITEDTKAERTTDNESNSSNTGQDEKTTEDGKGKTIKDVNNPQDQKEQQKERGNQNSNQNDKGPVKDDSQRKDQDKKKYTV